MNKQLLLALFVSLLAVAPSRVGAVTPEVLKEQVDQVERICNRQEMGQEGRERGEEWTALGRVRGRGEETSHASSAGEDDDEEADNPFEAVVIAPRNTGESETIFAERVAQAKADAKRKKDARAPIIAGARKKAEAKIAEIKEELASKESIEKKIECLRLVIAQKMIQQNSFAEEHHAGGALESFLGLWQHHFGQGPLSIQKQEMKDFLEREFGLSCDYCRKWQFNRFESQEKLASLQAQIERLELDLSFIQELERVEDTHELINVALGYFDRMRVEESGKDSILSTLKKEVRDFCEKKEEVKKLAKSILAFDLDEQSIELDLSKQEDRALSALAELRAEDEVQGLIALVADEVTKLHVATALSRLDEWCDNRRYLVKRYLEICDRRNYELLEYSSKDLVFTAALQSSYISKERHGADYAGMSKYDQFKTEIEKLDPKYQGFVKWNFARATSGYVPFAVSGGLLAFSAAGFALSYKKIAQENPDLPTKEKVLVVLKQLGAFNLDIHRGLVMRAGVYSLAAYLALVAYARLSDDKYAHRDVVRKFMVKGYLNRTEGY